MSRRRWTVHLTVEPERTMLRGWRTLDAAKAVGARPMWLAASRSWSVAPRFTGDVLAWLEHAGAQVVLAGPRIASPEAIPPKLATAVASSSEPDLVADLPQGLEVPTPLASSPTRATCSGEQVMAETVQCIGQFDEPMLPFDGAA